MTERVRVTSRTRQTWIMSKGSSKWTGLSPWNMPLEVAGIVLGQDEEELLVAFEAIGVRKSRRVCGIQSEKDRLDR